MEISDITPGLTIHCWEPGKKYMAHRFILYLGPDKNVKDNILVQSVNHGWDIISMAELPKDKFRVMGDYNIIETLKDSKKETVGFVYRFHDGLNNPIPITVKLVRGVWRVKKDFQSPSWIKKEEVSNSRSSRS